MLESMPAWAGILPRTGLHISKELKRLGERLNMKVEVEVSSLEVYCENIRQLLIPE